MRTIDADDFGNRMYHEVFEKDTDMQKWDSGCWVRYKLFENVLREQPTIEPRCEACEAFNKTRLLIPQPERKKGKWIYKKDLKQFFCSECGFPSLTYDDVYIYLMDLPNYCEDCGADMRKGAGRRTDDR